MRQECMYACMQYPTAQTTRNVCMYMKYEYECMNVYVLYVSTFLFVVLPGHFDRRSST